MRDMICIFIKKSGNLEKVINGQDHQEIEIKKQQELTIYIIGINNYKLQKGTSNHEFNA